MSYSIGLFEEAAQLQREMTALCQCIKEAITEVAGMVDRVDSSQKKAPMSTNSL